MRRYLAAVITLCTAAAIHAAPETPPPSAQDQPPRAARSVHLAYQAPEAVLFYNEVTVEQSQKGTYFCVCGFNHGYFGIQERAGDKVVIFSVWDPTAQDNPDAVSEDKRVRLLHRDPDVKTGRFGGEGTGGQSFLTYDWQPGETYRFLVKAKAAGDRTEYAAYFYLNGTGSWKHLVTFSTIAGGDLLKGYYSFVEDFRRDGQSPREMRRARFQNGWVKTPQDTWIALTRARFTADSNPLMNIDAGLSDTGFYLQTGGTTTNQTPLWSTLDRLPPTLSLPEE